jgi:hypothetical protein
MSEVSWQAESLRATAFYNVGNTPSDVNRLWELLMHRQPDQVSSRPNERIHVAEGTFGGNEKQLRCAIGPDRVDWLLRAAPPPPNREPDGLLTVGTLAGVLSSFQDLGTRWLDISSDIIRLAFGAVLLFEVSSTDEANARLNALLSSVSFEPEGVSDFLFRINRQRALSSLKGGSANRLGTWSSVQVGSVGIAIQGRGSPQVTHGRGNFACRLELDINTAGTFETSLSGAEAAEVFRELVGLGTEIAEQGEKP